LVEPQAHGEDATQVTGLVPHGLGQPCSGVVGCEISNEILEDRFGGGPRTLEERLAGKVFAQRADIGGSGDLQLTPCAST
jgi:hypothetical protein